MTTLSFFSYGMAVLSLAYLYCNEMHSRRAFASPFFVLEAIAWLCVAGAPQ